MTAPSTVVGAGTEVVRITSLTPFQTVFAFVDNSSGFLQFALKAPTTDVTLVTTTGANLPAGPFTADYRVGIASGAVGPSATVPTTGVASSAPAANVTGTWAQGGTPVVVLAQSGATVTGNEIFPPLPGVQVSFASTIQGTVSGNTLSGTNTGSFKTTDGSNISCSETDGFVLTIAGSTMTGTYTTGTFTCNIAGFAQPGGLPFSITLTKQ